MKNFNGVFKELTHDEKLEIHKLIYGMARNTWSLFLILSELVTGERFNPTILKELEKRQK